MSRSTFSVLFYVNRGKEKNGIVPVMGRVTINCTQSQFSCKKSIPLALWDAKGNCAKGRSKESLQLNRDLDNIKAQIIKHYQHLCDREAFVTAEMVRNSYQGFGSEYETLLNALRATLPSNNVNVIWLERNVWRGNDDGIRWCQQFVINYEDSVRRRYEMEQQVAKKDSTAKRLMMESDKIKKMLE